MVDDSFDIRGYGYGYSKKQVNALLLDDTKLVFTCISGTSSLTQYTTNIDVLLLLFLDLLSGLLLFCFLAIQVRSQVGCRSGSSWLSVNNICDLSFARSSHLFTVEFFVSTDRFVRLALGFFARRCTSNTASY
jgi:hypothetical protein